MKRTDLAGRMGIRSGAPKGWPDRFPVVSSARPALIFLALLLLFGSSSLFQRSVGPNWSNPGGFGLNDDLSSSNLNNTSAGAPALFPGVAPDPEIDFDDADEVPLLIVPALHSTQQEIAAGPLLGDFLSFNQHQGDTPMIRSWKALGLQTILAAMFTAAPALAQDSAAADAQKASAQKIDEIQKQAVELQKTLASLQKAVDSIKTDLGNLRTESQLGVQNAEKKANELKEEMARLKFDVEQLGTRVSTPQRIAAFPPAEPAAASARVEMVNTFPEEVTIVVNRLSYRLVPGERRQSEPVPAGTFTYEVLGVTPSRTRTIGPNQVFTVSVYPQL